VRRSQCKQHVSAHFFYLGCDGTRVRLSITVRVRLGLGLTLDELDVDTDRLNFELV